MLERKAPPTRNGPNTGSLALGVRRRVKKKVAFVVLMFTKVGIYTWWQPIGAAPQSRVVTAVTTVVRSC